MVTTLCSMKDNIIFRLCDLRDLCGGKITFLQWSHILIRIRLHVGGGTLAALLFHSTYLPQVSY